MFAHCIIKSFKVNVYGYNAFLTPKFLQCHDNYGSSKAMVLKMFTL